MWQNGGLVPQDKARLAVSDPGVQYGFGFFETIRVDKGVPAYMVEHAARFSRCWHELFQTPVPDIDWQIVIDKVIRKNRLTDKTAAVKLMATRGRRSTPPYDHQLFVTAQEYTGRPVLAENGGLRLSTDPNPRQTPLADFKTLNYLYYFLAGCRARKQGADEALILNPDGSISESHTGNVLMLERHTIIVPSSPHVLSGVMQAQVLKNLKAMGYIAKVCRCFPEDLFSVDGVVITNSLIGAVPALSLDGRALGSIGRRLCREICRQVL